MATNFTGSSGFGMPGIDYTLTKPIDIVGAIGRGMALGNSLLDLPNTGRARQITTQQQNKILGGNLELMGAKVDADGGVAGEYDDKVVAQNERLYGGLKNQNVLNTIANRDANTGANIGYKTGMLGINQQKADEYGKTQQHGREVTGRNPNNLYEDWQLPGNQSVTTNTSAGQAPQGDLASRVKQFEGFNPNAYSDIKQTSIGYGTKARPGETVISREEAERRLGEELMASRAEVDALDKQAGYGFTEEEKNALTSFAYNLGGGGLNQLTANGTRDRNTIARKMLEYNKADGRVEPGLVRRRSAESQWFVGGAGQQPQAQADPRALPLPTGDGSIQGNGVLPPNPNQPTKQQEGVFDRFVRVGNQVLEFLD